MIILRPFIIINNIVNRVWMVYYILWKRSMG